METVENKKQIKTKTKKNELAGIRVSKETRRELIRLVDKINKKQFGRKVKASEVIATCIKLISEKEIEILQQSTLSNADKFEMEYRDYIRENGAISKDDYFGKVIAIIHDQKPSVTQ